jgi:hypothetical protein
MELQLEWLVCTTYEVISFQPEIRRAAICRVADPSTSGSSSTGAVVTCGVCTNGASEDGLENDLAKWEDKAMMDNVRVLLYEEG